MAYREKTVAVHGAGGVVSLQRTIVNEEREIWYYPQAVFHGPLVPFDAALRAQERAAIQAFADRGQFKPEEVLKDFFGSQWYLRMRYDNKFSLWAASQLDHSINWHFGAQPSSYALR